MRYCYNAGLNAASPSHGTSAMARSSRRVTFPSYPLPTACPSVNGAIPLNDIMFEEIYF